MKDILIVDDEPEMLTSLEKILSRKKEFSLTLMQDSAEAIRLAENRKFDLIITDLKMKKISGLDLLRSALNKFPDSTVIMISGYGTIDASVEAMREGAFDFIEKPFSSQKLYDCIDRALGHQNKTQSQPASQPTTEKSIDGFIYKSQQMDEVLEIARKISSGNMNVLITGESGTGKELVARAIHRMSKRSLNPFVPVNCGALPESLFESELFGHERGAFTGALKTKPGLLEFANQGTFFFDEIGDMSLPLQVKLLRMLEERKIRRVGGQSEIDIDVRIIAATNKDLAKAVNEKKFRADLFYRINTIQIHIPPLRERRDDILPLAYHFLNELSSKNDKVVQRISPEAEDALLAYPWAGNIRELQNIIGRAYFLSSEQIISRADLPMPLSNPSEIIDNEILSMQYKDAKEAHLEKFECEYLTRHLKKNHGNISVTASQCGLDRRTIHRLIKKYNIIYRE